MVELLKPAALQCFLIVCFANLAFKKHEFFIAPIPIIAQQKLNDDKNRNFVNSYMYKKSNQKLQ